MAYAWDDDSGSTLPCQIGSYHQGFHLNYTSDGQGGSWDGGRDFYTDSGEKTNLGFGSHMYQL